MSLHSDIYSVHYFISLPNNILYWYVMILYSWKSASFLLVFLCFQHLFKLPHALVWHKMKRNWFSVQLMNEKVAKTCVHRFTRTAKLYITSTINICYLSQSFGQIKNKLVSGRLTHTTSKTLNLKQYMQHSKF